MSRLARIRNNERGSAMVEAPFAIIVLMAIGLGAFWISNLVLRHHQLDEAVHAGTRYATRAYYAPSSGPARRRTAAEIEAFVKQAAQPLSSDPSKMTIEVLCGPSPETMTACPNPEQKPSGTYLEVRARSVVARDDPVMGFARSVNALLSALHAPEPFPDSAVARQSSIAVIE